MLPAVRAQLVAYGTSLLQIYVRRVSEAVLRGHGPRRVTHQAEGETVVVVMNRDIAFPQDVGCALECGQ